MGKFNLFLLNDKKKIVVNGNKNKNDNNCCRFLYEIGCSYLKSESLA